MSGPSVSSSTTMLGSTCGAVGGAVVGAIEMLSVVQC